VPVPVAVDVDAEALDEVRPLGTRPDEGHVPPQDGPELWQLVQGGAPEEPADGRDAVVADR
jgi:hypothetical protein